MSSVPSSPPPSLLQGILAINKPQGLTSAACLRSLQNTLSPSALFAPLISQMSAERGAESGRQQRRRRDRRNTTLIKIGHGGTLDPLAIGVLITGIGRGTKQLPTFLSCSKTYETVVLFGAETDTYDRVGKTVARKPTAHITRALVESKLDAFRGKIMQRPPIYSALRVQGKKMYEYARSGVELPKAIEARPVEVLELELLEYWEGGTHQWRWPGKSTGLDEMVVGEKILEFGPDMKAQQMEMEKKRKRALEGMTGDAGGKRARVEAVEKNSSSSSGKRGQTEGGEELMMSGGLGVTPEPDETHQEPCAAPACRLRITSTSGFYVRSLCHDLGQAVGSLGLMAELVRTRQGEYELGKGKVLEWSDLQEGEAVWEPVVRRLLSDQVEVKKGDSAVARTRGPTKNGTMSPTKDGTMSPTTEKQVVSEEMPAREEEVKAGQEADEKPLIDQEIVNGAEKPTVSAT